MLLPKTWIICRVCLKQQEEIFHLFEDAVIKGVWSILRDCGGVPVRRNDDLPDKICKSCLKRLWTARSFRIDCQRGHRELVQMQMERKVNMYELDLKEQKKCYSEVISVSDTSNMYPASTCITTPHITVTQSENPKKVPINEKTEASNSKTKQYCIVTRNTKDKKDDEEKAKLLNRKEPIVLLLKLKTSTSQENSVTNDQNASITETQRISHKVKSKINEKSKLKSNIMKVRSKKLIRPNSKLNSRTANNSIKRMGKYKCKVCMKICRTILLLRHHMYSHNKPHQCKICNKSFSQKHSFLSHNNLHTGIKPYYCRFCYITFSDISNRNTHERNSHKNQKFKCEKCNKFFRFSPLLEKHAQSHRPKKCFICNREFASLQMVRLHHKRRHLKLLKCEN